MTACDLRATQVVLQIVLHLAGPLTINEMAEHLDLDRTPLSRNLKPLEERGLLTIQLSADQRTRLVTLTEASTRALLQALPIWEAAQAYVEQLLGEDRFSTLLKPAIQRKLARHLPCPLRQLNANRNFKDSANQRGHHRRDPGYH